MQSIHVIQAKANRWANGLLYAELARLAPEQLNQGLGVNFGSVLGLANHTVLADHVWLARLSGEPQPDIASLPKHADFAALRAAREREDGRIVAFAEAELGTDSPALLDQTLRYNNFKGEPQVMPARIALAQFFSHQSFHRGQLHTLLGVFGITAPDLDLIYFYAA